MLRPEKLETGSKAKRPRPSRPPFQIADRVVEAGAELRFDLPLAQLPTRTQLSMPVTVLHGRRAGPTLWVSAAVHGDEVNGVEVISRLLDKLQVGRLRGTLLAIPIVNAFGFTEQSRYLPDGRDLNRSFPGSKRGSLAARVARLFLDEVVSRSSHGIDLHTATNERINLPQVRGDLDDPETLRCANAFNAPAMVHSVVRNGSLRGVANSRGVPVLVYEGGEARRFNESAITIGVRGVLSVMKEIGMLPKSRRAGRWTSAFIEDSTWIRARASGIFRSRVKEGQLVAAGQIVGTLSDVFGDNRVILRSPFDGMVIGRTLTPVVHGGDAVVHVGRVRSQVTED